MINQRKLLEDIKYAIRNVLLESNTEIIDYDNIISDIDQYLDEQNPQLLATDKITEFMNNNPQLYYQLLDLAFKYGNWEYDSYYLGHRIEPDENDVEVLWVIDLTNIHNDKIVDKAEAQVWEILENTINEYDITYAIETYCTYNCTYEGSYSPKSYDYPEYYPDVKANMTLDGIKDVRFDDSDINLIETLPELEQYILPKMKALKLVRVSLNEIKDIFDQRALDDYDPW